MQAAYHPAHRTGQAVLDERGRVKSGSTQYLRIEGTAEEAAIIDMRAWPQQQGTIDARNRNDVHEFSLPAAGPMLARSRPPGATGRHLSGAAGVAALLEHARGRGRGGPGGRDSRTRALRRRDRRAARGGLHAYLRLSRVSTAPAVAPGILPGSWGWTDYFTSRQG